jgi:hypothetical protein
VRVATPTPQEIPMSSYLANKKMNLAGTIYEKGEVVPAKVMSEITENRKGALLRTRLIIEVETAPKPEGDMCPHCKEGPFQRLAQHVSLKHEDILLAEDEHTLPADEAEGDDSPTEEEE